MSSAACPERFAVCSPIHSRTFGSSVYTASIDGVQEEFHVSSTVALLGLALYVVGLGFGPVLGAPVSETLGRNMVYRISTPICMVFTLGAGFSQTITQLVVCRFLAGLFGSPVLAVGAGSNADMWPPRIRAVSTSVFMMAPFAGPALGYVSIIFGLASYLLTIHEAPSQVVLPP